MLWRLASKSVDLENKTLEQMSAGLQRTHSPLNCGRVVFDVHDFASFAHFLRSGQFWVLHAPMHVMSSNRYKMHGNVYDNNSSDKQQQNSVAGTFMIRMMRIFLRSSSLI